MGTCLSQIEELRSAASKGSIKDEDAEIANSKFVSIFIIFRL